MIQEPWVVEGMVRGLGNKSLCFRDSKVGRRAAVLVKVLNAIPVLELCTGDLAVIRIRYPRLGRIIIGSAYLPYDSEAHPTKEFCRMVDHCKVRGLPLLVGCDANSHHQVWGSTDTNRRGEDLLEYLMNSDLDVLNRDNEPTFRNSIRAEVIDITLCSKAIADEVMGWRVSNEPFLSDHAYILFQMSDFKAPVSR